jgi:spore maturation protein CgeB
MQQSKICLNSMPFFKNGTHERVLAGLACGAVPVTTDNIYFREFFRDNEDLLYYSMKDKSSVNDRVNDLLAQESKRAKIADSGRKIVMENYTWDVRVNDLLEILPSLFSGVQARLAFHRPPSS